MATKATYQKPYGSPVFDQVFLSTWDKMRDTLIDQYFRKFPALVWMMDRKDTDLIGDGGEQFIVPMEVGENPTVGAIDYDEGISMDDYDPFMAGRYDARLVGGGVANPMELQVVNKGSGKNFSIYQKKTENTVKTIRKALSFQLWSGNGTKPNALGLPTLIPATAKTAQTTTIGGIDQSTYTWFRTQAINMANMGAANDLESQMLNMYNTIVAEAGAPDVIFTDQTDIEIYETNARDFFVVDSKVKVADVTFELCKYKNMPMIWDVDAPAGELRMITSENFKFLADPAFWFRWTAEKELPDVPFKTVKQCVVRYNFARLTGRDHGCIYNIAV